MALVLWEPPSKHLRMLSTRVMSQPPTANDGEENNNTNNNNEQIADMNESTFEIDDVELEPMDL